MKKLLCLIILCHIVPLCAMDQEGTGKTGDQSIVDMQQYFGIGASADNTMQTFLHSALTQQVFDASLLRKLIEQLGSIIQLTSKLLAAETQSSKTANPEWSQKLSAYISNISCGRYALQLGLTSVEGDAVQFEDVKGKIHADTQLSAAQKEKLFLIKLMDNEGAGDWLAWMKAGTNTSDQEDTLENFLKKVTDPTERCQWYENLLGMAHRDRDTEKFDTIRVSLLADKLIANTTKELLLQPYTVQPFAKDLN